MSGMPNFFIVGAARCGTTSLNRYLGQHPEIYLTPKKETHFFASDFIPPSFTGPGDERLNQRLIRNKEEYAKISHYILTNPQNWPGDKFYEGQPKS